MKKKYKEFIIILLFVFLSLFIFRDYFLKGSVPFPANLLVSFYQPWVSYQWEGYPQGPPNKPIGFDNLRIFYPLRTLTIDQIKNFQWPLWNPYYFSGNILLASYQSAVFHPLSFLFFFLPQIDAWSIIIILQPFLASVFMYLFLREILLSRKASVFGAITFAFSGFMIVWFEESFMSSYSSLFLPLILYGIEKIFKKITPRNFSILVLGLSFSLLSGWFQMTLYTWGFALIWSIYRFLRERKDKVKTMLVVIASYALAIMISSIHLIPSIEAYFYSARGTTDVKFIFDSYLQPFSHLITYIVPDFFGNPAAYNYFGSGFYHEKVIFVGIAALVFALYELISLAGLDFKEKFFKWAWIITLSLGFSLPTSWFILYNLKLPFLPVILPSRIFFLSTFSVSVLAAFGIERYLRNPDKKKLAIVSLFLGLVFILIWRFVLQHFATITFRNLMLPSAFFVFITICVWLGIFKSLRSKVYLVILTVAFASSFYFANKYLYFSDRRMGFPQTPVLSELEKISGIDRIWSFGNAYIERNLITQYRLFSPEGYDSFYISRFGELLYAGQNKGKFSNQIPRADATLSQANRYKEVLADPYRKRLLSLLSVRYIVGQNSKDQDLVKEKKNPDLELVWQDKVFNIYKYNKALPRVFLANDYIVIPDNQKALDAIFNPETDLSKKIILEEEPMNFSKSMNANGVAEVVSYMPNKINIDVKSDKTALLFISDNYYPGWKAFVDGSETKIYRADYSFRAIALPQGNHRVVFKYDPVSFRAGLFISLSGLLLLILICTKIKLRGSNI